LGGGGRRIQSSRPVWAIYQVPDQPQDPSSKETTTIKSFKNKTKQNKNQKRAGEVA
jgi:hypothetical protein